MFINVNIPQNPLVLITSKKNKQFVEYLLSNGMNPEKISGLLIKFFDFKVLLRAMFKQANNQEWLEMRSWHNTIGKHYKKAIQILEKLLSDESIPSITRETIIKKDIENLKSKKNFLTLSCATESGIKPEPVSVQQMLNFQSFALFQYLKRFKGSETDSRIYDFIAELFRNLYTDTVLSKDMKSLTGDLLKKNFIDNVDKLRKKYDDLESAIKPYLTK